MSLREHIRYNVSPPAEVPAAPAKTDKAVSAVGKDKQVNVLPLQRETEVQEEQQLSSDVIAYILYDLTAVQYSTLKHLSKIALRAEYDDLRELRSLTNDFYYNCSKTFGLSWSSLFHRGEQSTKQ